MHHEHRGLMRQYFELSITLGVFIQPPTSSYLPSPLDFRHQYEATTHQEKGVRAYHTFCNQLTEAPINLERYLASGTMTICRDLNFDLE